MLACRVACIDCITFLLMEIKKMLGENMIMNVILDTRQKFKQCKIFSSLPELNPTDFATFPYARSFLVLSLKSFGELDGLAQLQLVVLRHTLHLKPFCLEYTSGKEFCYVTG